MNRDITVKHIVERLGNAEIDHQEYNGRGEGAEGFLKAGVLIPIFLTPGKSEDDCELSFLLSKRSPVVSQGGDLSGTGGKLEPFWDRLLSFFITRGVPPIIRGDALKYARKRGKTSFDTITLFLANAARESWEEIGLNPLNLRFLGPLPPRKLLLLNKTIFPVAGLIEKKWNFRPNREVEKLVEIPLSSFYNEENYASFHFQSPELEALGFNKKEGVPCLIHRGKDGEKDILWGATFGIVTSFLSIVFDFELPNISPHRIVRRELQSDYMRGRKASSQTP